MDSTDRNSRTGRGRGAADRDRDLPVHRRRGLDPAAGTARRRVHRGPARPPADPPVVRSSAGTASRSTPRATPSSPRSRARQTPSPARSTPSAAWRRTLARGTQVRVRMGIHTGEARVEARGYVGSRSIGRPGSWPPRTAARSSLSEAAAAPARPSCRTASRSSTSASTASRTSTAGTALPARASRPRCATSRRCGRSTAAEQPARAGLGVRRARGRARGHRDPARNERGSG